MKIEEFALEREGPRLAGLICEPEIPTGKAPVVLCHGIPSGMPPDPDDAGYPGLASRLCERGRPCAIFNFRGTGRSEGSFSLPGWRDDLLDLVPFLCARPGWSSGVVLAGFSGGGAAAVLAAQELDRVLGVAALAAPADFGFMLRIASPEDLWRHFVTMGIVDVKEHPYPAAWASSFSQVSIEAAVGNIDGRPLLFVHGEQDRTVPVDHCRRLYAAAGEPKELVLLPEAGHRLRHEPRTIESLEAWLDRHFNGIYGRGME